MNTAGLPESRVRISEPMSDTFDLDYTSPELPAAVAAQNGAGSIEPPVYRQQYRADGTPLWRIPPDPNHLSRGAKVLLVAKAAVKYVVAPVVTIATAVVGVAYVASKSSSDIVQPANSHSTMLVPPSASYDASPTAEVTVASTPTPKSKPKPPTPSQPPETSTPTAKPNATPAPHWVNVRTSQGLVGEFAICTTGSNDKFKDGSEASTADVIDNSGVKLPDC